MTKDELIITTYIVLITLATVMWIIMHALRWAEGRKNDRGIFAAADPFVLVIGWYWPFKEETFKIDLFLLVCLIVMTISYIGYTISAIQAIRAHYRLSKKDDISATDVDRICKRMGLK